MDPITIRSARPDDAETVEDYHHRCFLATYPSQIAAGEITPPNRDGTREQLLEWFQPRSSFDTHVAVIDDLVIGHFTVCGHQLVHLFVTPEYQGTGLGGHLLATGEAMLTQAGHTELELHARVENVSAIAFYEAAGWTVTDRLFHTVEHGITYDEHILVKQVPSTS